MISTNVFMTLAGAFILLVGSVASLVYAKVGAPVMLTGWMVSLFGLHIMNNNVHVGGADLVLGSGYGFVVGLVAAVAACYAGYWANYHTSSPTQPTGLSQLPTSGIESGQETVPNTAESAKSPVGSHVGPELIIVGFAGVIFAFLLLVYEAARGVSLNAPIVGISAIVFGAGCVMMSVGGLIAWVRAAAANQTAPLRTPGPTIIGWSGEIQPPQSTGQPSQPIPAQYQQPYQPLPPPARKRKTSRWDSPRLEIITGAVVLAFFSFVQIVEVYLYIIGVQPLETSGLIIFFILWGVALIVHGMVQKRRNVAQPPFR